MDEQKKEILEKVIEFAHKQNEITGIDTFNDYCKQIAVNTCGTIDLYLPVGQFLDSTLPEPNATLDLYTRTHTYVKNINKANKERDKKLQFSPYHRLILSDGRSSMDLFAGEADDYFNVRRGNIRDLCVSGFLNMQYGRGGILPVAVGEGAVSSYVFTDLFYLYDALCADKIQLDNIKK